MPEPEPKRDDTPVADHFRQAVDHAEQALRCYATLIRGQAERLAQAFVRRLLAVLLLASLGLIGLFFVALGLARYLQSVLKGMEGAGLLCVGIGIVCTVLVCLLLLRDEDEGGR